MDLLCLVYSLIWSRSVVVFFGQGHPPPNNQPNTNQVIELYFSEHHSVITFLQTKMSIYMFFLL